MKRLEAFLDRRAFTIVLALAAAAFLRTLFFCLAFPFFDNVDEQAHFDVADKYSRLHLPRSLEPYGREAAIDIVLYGSPEFLQPPLAPTRPPLWTEGLRYDPAALERRLGVWKDSPNHEATQPPVYYAAAGAWRALGRGLGLDEGALLYWTRCLYAPLAALLALSAYALAALARPRDTFLKLGAPALVAFLPQDAFYAINKDALAALWGSAACCALLRVRQGRVGLWPALAGLSAAAAVLTVYSNAPILALVAAAAALESGGGRRRRRGAVILLLAAAAPVAAWFLRNHLVLGDVTGTAAKLAFLGVTPKPPSQWLDHPIYGPRGLVYFVSRTLTTFWRGEFVWKGAELYPRAFDVWFAASSAVFVALGAAAWGRDGRWLILGWIALELAFLGWMSVAFNFNKLLYPSPAVPFETSGRLILSVLVPFLLLYLQGLEEALRRLGRPRLKWLALAAFLSTLACQELRIAAKVLPSPYNAFHLPS